MVSLTMAAALAVKRTCGGDAAQQAVAIRGIRKEDRPGRDAVHADIGSPLQREEARECGEPGLRCGVVRKALPDLGGAAEVEQVHDGAVSLAQLRVGCA